MIIVKLNDLQIDLTEIQIKQDHIMFVLFKADACLETPFTDSCNNKNENIF